MTVKSPRQTAQRVAVVGLGYFSAFHLQAWASVAGVELVFVCDSDVEKAREKGLRYGVAYGTDLGALLAANPVDIVDVVAPPSAHAALVRVAAARGRTIICQKPFTQSLDEAEAMRLHCEDAGTQVVIHENFRFQPWHREIQDLLRAGSLGQIYQARFALRPGDGQGPDAYLARQPTFQTMPRFLIHETGVHFIDLFRWWFGDISSVYADLRQLNPSIAGEDAGLLLMHHASGVQTVFDGNRLADHAASNHRHTMGELTIDAEQGELRLDGDGALHLRHRGELTWRAVPLARPVEQGQFGGGCVSALIRHVVEALQRGLRPENTLEDYLPVMHACDAAYRSAEQRRRVDLPSPD